MTENLKYHFRRSPAPKADKDEAYRIKIRLIKPDEFHRDRPNVEWAKDNCLGCRVKNTSSVGRTPNSFIRGVYCSTVQPDGRATVFVSKTASAQAGENVANFSACGMPQKYTHPPGLLAFIQRLLDTPEEPSF